MDDKLTSRISVETWSHLSRSFPHLSLCLSIYCFTYILLARSCSICFSSRSLSLSFSSSLSLSISHSYSVAISLSPLPSYSLFSLTIHFLPFVDKMFNALRCSYIFTFTHLSHFSFSLSLSLSLSLSHSFYILASVSHFFMFNYQSLSAHSQ